MSDRVTAKNLRAVATRINAATDSPDTYSTLHADGSRKIRVGHYLIDEGSATYRRAWALSRVVNSGGGQEMILRAQTARGLLDLMYAWLDGRRSAQHEEHTTRAALNGRIA